jgi:hypothetical protein
VTAADHGAVATDTAIATDQRPRLLFFFDPRDGIGRRTEGFLAQVLQHRRNHETFRTTRIDVAARRDLAERFEIVRTPTFLVVTDHRVRARLEQPKGVLQIEEALRPWLR